MVLCNDICIKSISYAIYSIHIVADSCQVNINYILVISIFRYEYFVLLKPTASATATNRFAKCFLCVGPLLRIHDSQQQQRFCDLQLAALSSADMLSMTLHAPSLVYVCQHNTVRCRFLNCPLTIVIANYSKQWIG